MSKKQGGQSKKDAAGVVPLNAMQPHEDPRVDIPDFTPAQWAWLKAQASAGETDYVPTRSLIPGF